MPDRPDEREHGVLWPGTPGTERPERAPSPEPAPAAGPAPYEADVPAAAAAALLAAATFFPWYKTFGLSASGWGTGTWGPVVFFLAIASLALIALRRAGVRVALPVEEPLVHEAIGWLSAALIVIKALRRPAFGPAGFGVPLGNTWGLWVALVASLGLALLAGRMLPGAALVYIPGWHRDAGGRLGALVLALALVAGAAFGLSNDGLSTPQSSASPVEPIRGRFPGCLEEVPVPSGLRPSVGYESKQGNASACVSQADSAKSVRTVARAFETGLRKDKWRYSATQRRANIVLLQLLRPRCGSVLIAKDPAGAGSDVTMTLSACLPTPPPAEK